MLGALLNLITGGVTAWQQHSRNKAEALKRKDELEQAKHTARLKRLEYGDEKAATLDELSIKGRGWKDEFILLVVFTPLMLCFWPDYAGYVDAGFQALSSIPEPYWYVVGAIVVDVLGMRSMVRYLLEFFSHKFRGKPT
ncbi:hypothetical protein L6J37_06545 [Photobacterium sp. WH77]|uniref:hypothetical protein n=1 Tax=unclassified Photobacterium TaxID=2628852 RepID=UPI001ED9CB80|nr:MULTISPECIES: hypothetical protein [unclassified Photobacterium]MCG2836522.1 hypothetical protein [Photobacterium sp. WH77]MCG2844351.1 hypothetical protein [Photobacterium sp. WH80]